MPDIESHKIKLIEYAEKLHKKHELAKVIDPFTYDPGNTEFLEYFDGVYSEQDNLLILFTEVKGLRYEDRSIHLESVRNNDSVILKRDLLNSFNSNNFEVFNRAGESLGSLPAELCNCIAPLYDNNYINIKRISASYIEQFKDRSRYAKQGVLFVEIHIRFGKEI